MEICGRKLIFLRMRESEREKYFQPRGVFEKSFVRSYQMKTGGGFIVVLLLLLL